MKQTKYGLVGNRFSDKTGMKFGNLTVVELVGLRGKESLWKCLCSCGVEIVVQGNNLKSGHTRSCGCVRGLDKITHGLRESKIYNVWNAMVMRCHNQNSTEYKNYGGRGIEVCEQWRAFQNFFNDMGIPPFGMSIDRINNNGNYEPSNCRWATKFQQDTNRRNNRMVLFRGESKALVAWCKELDLNYKTVHCRLRGGTPVESALSKKTPKGYGK